MSETKNESRYFLLRDLPPPLTRASEHTQIFDNYIKHTKLRLRAERFPLKNEWKWSIQNFSTHEASTNIIPIDEVAFEILKELSRGEVRKNRYVFETAEIKSEIDVFLGKLWGICIAEVQFRDPKKDAGFPLELPVFLEISGNEYFFGDSLAVRTFDEVNEKVAAISGDSRK